MASDGLEELEAERARRTGGRMRRQAPPPKNPRPRKQEEQDHTQPTDRNSEPTPVAPAEQLAQPAQERSQHDERQQVEDLAAPSVGGTGRERPTATQVYLDADLDDWLWDIRAMAAQQRADVPVSAVVRRALRELRSRTTVEQLVASLSQPTRRTGRRGRPKR